MIFASIRAAFLREPVRTQDATLYLFRGFSVVGLKPPKEFSVIYAIYAYVNYVWLVFVLPLCFLFGCLQALSEFTPGELVKTLQVDINAWGFSVKYLIVYWLIHKLKETNDLLDKLDNRCSAAWEQQKIRTWAAIGNRIFLMYFIFYMSFMLATLAEAILHGRPPFYMYNPFIDWRSSRLNFILECCLEFILVAFGVFTEQLIDCMPIIYVLLLRAHVQMLAERVYNIGMDMATSEADNLEELISCVQDHKNMLKICDAIRPLFSLTIFVQCLVCGTALGLTVINLLLFADPLTAIGSAIYLLIVLLQTFPLCYLCNCLIEDCHSLADNVFHSQWYHRDRTFRKTLLYFLHRVQQPMTFTALGIFPINVATNISFAKFAFTVYTLAKQMKLDEKFSTK